MISVCSKDDINEGVHRIIQQVKSFSIIEHP